MKFIFFILLSVSANAMAKQNNTYHVQVDTERGPMEFTVQSPSDSMALDSVLVGVLYNKRLPFPMGGVVKETGLSSYDLPQRIFVVITEDKSYKVVLSVVNPEYAMTAIQASKFVMSKTSTRDVYSNFADSTLKSRPAVKYTVQYTNKEASYLLNTNNSEEGIVAFDIAAKLSPQRAKYVKTSTKVKSCQSMFVNY